jgi:hypothetical protein
VTSLVVRSWRRRSVGALLLAAVVAGLTGGVVSGLLRGASRTRSAYDRFVDVFHEPDVYVVSDDASLADAHAVARVDGVDGVTKVKAGGLQLADSDLYLGIGTALDDHYGRDVVVGRIVEGRAARPDASDEVVLPEPIAALLHAGIGDQLRFESYTPEQMERVKTGEQPAPHGPDAAVTVVGIARNPTNVFTNQVLSDQIILPVGFERRYGDQIGAWNYFIMADAGSRPTVAEMQAVLHRIHAQPGFEQRPMNIATGSSVGPIQPTLDFVANGILVLAAVIAVTGLVATVLVLVRLNSGLAHDGAMLSMLGATRAARRSALALVALPAALGAAVLAAVAATATTAFVPFGVAERADPDPGVQLDAPSVVGGAVTIVAVVMLTAFVCAHRATAAGTRLRRASLLHSVVSRGNSPATVVGLTFAFDRGPQDSGRSGRIAVAGLALAGAALVATFMFVASSSYLLETPKAYGWTWDVQVEGEALDQVASRDEVAAASEVLVAGVTINDIPAEVRGVRTLSGPLPLRVVRGRAATGADEIAFGGRAMSALDVDIGDRVILGAGDNTGTFRVVGEVLSAGIQDLPMAASGAEVPFDALADLIADTDADSASTGVLTLAPGVDHQRFVQSLADVDGAEAKAVEPTPGADIERLSDANSLPWVVVVFLATTGAISLAAAAVSVVRRRRHDLGVLRAIGFTRADVRKSIVVQALAVASAGLAVGIPAGILLGRLVWRSFAGVLHVAVDVVTPWWLVGAFAAASLAVYGLCALLPARAAARIRAADVLRTE